ncbi:MAG: hypothetical protein ACXWXO_02180 [Nocardioides sp.]
MRGRDRFVFVLRPSDELLFAGVASARRALDATLGEEPTARYVIEGRIVPSGWLWRRLTCADSRPTG